MGFTVVTPAPQPHDLLRLSSVDLTPPDAPGWVSAALLATPWAVVRRAESTAGVIPVGVRGRRRADRYALTVTAGDIVDTVSPEVLTRRETRPGHRIPAMRTLDTVRSALDRTDLPWGPTGSVGFELATGVSTATDESDLDLLVRVPRLMPNVLAQLTELHGLFMAQTARVDCQVETRWGAVALAELVAEKPEILIRTGTGARLIPRLVAVS
jgi:phosphoribosyl-dephospho-CoA transferase